MSTETSRLGLDEPQASDTISGFPADDVEALGILDNAVIVSEGTLASLPLSSEYGNEYYATDTLQWFKYNGSLWQPMLTDYPSRATLASSESLTGGGWFRILTTSATFDTASRFSSGTYTCLRTGDYQINVNVGLTLAAGTNAVATGYYNNNTVTGEGGPTTMRGMDAGDSASGSYSDIISCNAGALLNAGVYLDNTGGGTLTSATFSVQPLG